MEAPRSRPREGATSSRSAMRRRSGAWRGDSLFVAAMGRTIAIGSRRAHRACTPSPRLRGEVT